MCFRIRSEDQVFKIDSPTKQYILMKICWLLPIYSTTSFEQDQPSLVKDFYKKLFMNSLLLCLIYLLLQTLPGLGLHNSWSHGWTRSKAYNHKYINNHNRGNCVVTKCDVYNNCNIGSSWWKANSKSIYFCVSG